jgi:outer membrane protein assembly factor BamB
MVYVAALDEMEVVALKADTGEIAWRFTPGGRVKIPPSYYRGFVLFGCGDGNVYCLAAEDGSLAWRFRAARARRLLHVRGRLESTWPVHTGIQVVDDVACFAAGREGTIDGGVDVYAVRADTGDIVWTKRWTRGPVVRLMVGDGKSMTGFGEKAAFSLKDGAGKRLPRLSSAAYYPSIVDLKHVTKMDDAALGELAKLQIRALARAGDVVVAAGFRREGQDQERRSKRRPRVFRDGRETEPVPSEYFLWLFSTGNGKELAERKLDSPPIFNSLAVAEGRAYLATRDGRLRCFGAK